VRSKYKVAFGSCSDETGSNSSETVLPVITLSKLPPGASSGLSAHGTTRGCKFYMDNVMELHVFQHSCIFRFFFSAPVSIFEQHIWMLDLQTTADTFTGWMVRTNNHITNILLESCLWMYYLCVISQFFVLLFYLLGVGEQYA
jgi:hypothetical protein